MFYFSEKTILESFSELKGKLNNQLFGLLSILRLIDTDNVQPNRSYRIGKSELSAWLDEQFYFGDQPATNSRGGRVSIKFSKKWLSFVKENYIAQGISIYPLAIFVLKYKSFENQLSKEEILDIFCKEFHLDLVDIKSLFTLNYIDIEYTQNKVERSQLNVALNANEHTIVFSSGSSYTKANAGELTRGPFFQPLYSSINNLKCLMIMMDDEIGEYYDGNENLHYLPKKFFKGDGTFAMQSRFLSALRTKPFMLLAGISGTGKSRLVRELAFMSCPKALQDQDQTQPGNFCMIEVKPNWHDSTELLGYWSSISNKYMFTPFVKFLVKAMMYPDVPFFVCLDEMNLAPVEQYLAELLSVLETRKRTSDKRIRTGALVSSEYFVKLAELDCAHDKKGNYYEYLKTDKEIYMKLFSLTSLQGDENENALAANTLCTSGLTLPDNVIIIGTVNMDDTTHKFSRKVIDRAMTIEMNGGELNSIFGGSSRLEYRADNEVVGLDAFKAKYVSADDAINDCLRMSPFAERVTGGEEEDGTLAHRLKAINDCLEGTPFQVSYRVMNELVIYLAVLLDSEEGEVSDERFDELMSQAVDDILLMKILPRIEGDEQMFVTSGGNRLDSLLELTSVGSTSHKKLLEMKERLEKSFFTRFWP